MGQYDLRGDKHDAVADIKVGRKARMDVSGCEDTLVQDRESGDTH